MKDPAEIIKKMGLFVDNIEKESHKTSIKNDQAYRLFLIDLLAESRRLVKACEKNLERYDGGK